MSIDQDTDELEKKHICFRCVEEAYLRDQIKKDRKIRKCAYCGQKRSCYDLSEMADAIEAAFEQYYMRTSDQPDSWQYSMLADKESDYEWERDGELVVYAIMNAAEIPEAAAQDIQAILDDRHADIESAQMGEETEFASDSYYEEKGADDSYWQEEWRNFEDSLKREARFFSQSAASHLAAIFDGIDEMRTWDGKPVVVDAGPDTAMAALYRARVFQSNEKLKEALGQPDRHLGSPPSPQAAAGRMNARGISVFYGANAPEAALAEVRPRPSAGSNGSLVRIPGRGHREIVPREPDQPSGGEIPVSKGDAFWALAEPPSRA